MRGQTGKGRWLSYPISPSVPVCLSLSLLCFLSFGLSLLVSSSVSSFSAVSLFFSLISLSSIAPLFSVLFSLCLCSISQSLIPASVSFPFPLTHSCLSASLPPSSPPTPSQLQGNGHRVYRKRGHGLRVYGPLDARGPKPSILPFPSTFRHWSPSFPQP